MYIRIPAYIIVCIYMLWLNPLQSYGQKEVLSEGYSLFRIEKSMTEEYAERKCLELARIDAIRKAFGDVVIQGNSTFIQNKSGERTETQNVFNFYSDTYANGEWIRDVKDPVIEKISQGDERWISVKVKCKVKALKPSQVNFRSEPCSCPDIKCFTDKFNDGQDFYVYFKSPVDGYVAIYLDVPKDQTTYRILPYQKFSSQTSYPVKADQEYFFFSSKHDLSNESNAVDELVLTLTEKNIAENNKVFILFSTKESLDKPILMKHPTTQAQKEIINDQFMIPAYLSSKEFQEWQQQIRGRNKDIEFRSVLISINPLNK